ncbi:hypothetical protein U1Q18_025469 [Sarracenia purpurea var. burkii]
MMLLEWALHSVLLVSGGYHVLLLVGLLLLGEDAYRKKRAGATLVQLYIAVAYGVADPSGGGQTQAARGGGRGGRVGGRGGDHGSGGGFRGKDPPRGGRGGPQGGGRSGGGGFRGRGRW